MLGYSLRVSNRFISIPLFIMPASTTQKHNNALDQLPQVVFGTSGLGNLYVETPYETKRQIVEACVRASADGVVFDTAGKYGAGLSLETIGRCLSDLGVDASRVLISNKLGWYRVPLTTPEPTFEPGVWKGLHYDAEQRISYEGILDCFEQGNTLLGEYGAQLVSVHDPDEYLAKAVDAADEAARYNDILEAYRALRELKDAGKVLGIGVGSKKWEVIQRISRDVELDWVMIANSLTVHDHPADLIQFVRELHSKQVAVINSAVFNGGFLVGSDHYNYQQIDPDTEAGKKLYAWRNSFWNLCDAFGLKPAEACFNFGFKIPGVQSVALNTTKPEKVAINVAMATKEIPSAFWIKMADEGLIRPDVVAHLG
ncbi:aldo/keto reductase [Sphingobacterium suaedae]|uniref:Aldo/keto reductase n=1 Tax=Sphingobacterium suaedae TaxID=1686402 RepID=A0ABW5KL35_9SPHI